MGGFIMATSNVSSVKTTPPPQAAPQTRPMPAQRTADDNKTKEAQQQAQIQAQKQQKPPSAANEINVTA
jgi:hypothetical protein